MAMFSPTIFRSYDVRGIWRTDFDGDFVTRFAQVIASYLAMGTIVVGRDGRVSSDEIAYDVIQGLVGMGARVIDIGEVSSPQCYWATRNLGALGCIMVTASHNPPEYNGLKVIVRRGDELDIIGGAELRQLYDSQEVAMQGEGRVETADIIPGYVAAVARELQWNDGAIQMSIDAPGAVQRALSLLAPIAPDHGLAIRFDADGDRIAFFESGRPVPADAILLLLIEHLGLKHVVYDLRFSRAVKEWLAEHDVASVVSRVGRPEQVRHMHESGASLGAEMSGHYYWKEFHGMEAPELTLMRVARIVTESGKNLGELIASYMTYAKSEELSFPIKDQKHGQGLLDALRVKYADGTVSTLDGLTIEYADWWFNVRMSNTEPMLRLVIEAPNKNLLDQKIEEVWGVLDA